MCGRLVIIGDIHQRYIYASSGSDDTTSAMSEQPKRAVVLLSGGLDSTTTLAIARARGFDCYALTVRYGQLHETEIDAARRVASMLGASRHRVVALDLRSLAVSALT